MWHDVAARHIKLCTRNLNIHHSKTIANNLLRYPSIRSVTSNMANSVPTTMKAIVINGNQAKVSSNVPVPKIRPTYLLAKVDSIALNPTDW